MIRIDDAHAIRLIAQVAGIDLGAKIYCIADYDNKDILIGGVLLMNDNGHSMEIHLASFKPNWLKKELLWAVFNYAFRVRKVKKLFGKIPENNFRSRRLSKHIGFREEVIINDIFPSGAGLVVMGMYEKDCRFINTKPPEVNFAPIEKTSIVKVHEYSHSNIGT